MLKKIIMWTIGGGLMLTSLTSFAAHWEPAADGRIPPRAWAVGYEDDGAPLYLCQARYAGSVTPGKIRSDFNGCHISYNGREISQPRYRVFVNRGGEQPNGFWVRRDDGSVPPRAWRVGRDTDGQPLFLCRARIGNGLAPGKVRPGIYGCDVPYGGVERNFKRYEVFVRRFDSGYGY